MPYQAWDCVACKKHGKVRYRKHAGVHEVLTAIGAAHRRKDNDCADKHGTTHVRAAASAPGDPT